MAAAFESVGRPTLAGRRGFAIAAGAVLLAALVVGAAWYVRRFVPLVLSEQRLVSTAETSHRAPSYSPDGSMLAFVAPDAANVLQVWVQNLAQGTTISITSGAASATRPRWSPKGDRIVYAVQGQGIWSTSPLGGTPQRIIERGTNPNFSRDGERLVYEASQGPLDGFGRWDERAGSAGAAASLVSDRARARILGDGSQIAFFHAELGPNGDLWVVPSGGGAARQLTFDTREGGWPVWTTDGRGIVFSSARAGSRTLWQVPAKGGEPIPLTTGAGEDDQPDLSADGRHVAYTNVRDAWELKVRDLDRGTERWLVQRGTEILFPMFSPDGRRVVLFGRADYAVAIFTIGADGSDLRALTGGRELNHQPRWGHDGKDVYFFQARPELSFRKVSALGGPSTSFHPWDWWTTNAPTFDPTGRFIVYCRNRPIGAPSTVAEHTVIHEVATGQEREWPEPHTHPGGWSPDGLLQSWDGGTTTPCSSVAWRTGTAASWLKGPHRYGRTACGASTSRARRMRRRPRCCGRSPRTDRPSGARRISAAFDRSIVSSTCQARGSSRGRLPPARGDRKSGPRRSGHDDRCRLESPADVSVLPLLLQLRERGAERRLWRGGLGRAPRAHGSALAAGGSTAPVLARSCSFIVSAMRLRFRSTSTTLTLTMSPALTTSRGSLTKRSASCETWTRPSWCTPMSTNAPKLATLVTTPFEHHARLRDRPSPGRRP